MVREKKTVRFETGFSDNFLDDRPAGQVIGRRNPDGILRQGSDLEGVIAVDHGALRIQPLVQPGWGRSGLAYGPYKRENGLAFAAVVLNGHNTSQTGPLADSLLRRLYRWARGSETDPILVRLLRWAKNGQKKLFTRQVLRWSRIAWDHRQPGNVEIDENLATGWFSRQAPSDPSHEGNAFVVHATGAENGELWVRSGTHPLPVVRGLQNIPVLYIVVLREKGAAYYLSSLPDSHGAAAFPRMRPVAVDWHEDSPQMYAAVSQSVLGQIGFRVDTRIYAAQVAHVLEYDQWFGSAHAADSMQGDGPLQDTRAEVGGEWKILAGNFERTIRGARAAAQNSLAVIEPGQPSGLINLLVEPAADHGSEVCLMWRREDADNYWSFSASSAGCRLDLKQKGEHAQIASSEMQGWQSQEVNSLQILDDGTEIILSLNGLPVFEARIADPRLTSATGIGIFIPNPYNGAAIHSFEAHPRSVLIPNAVNVCLPHPVSGSRVLVSTDFSGPTGDLAGRQTQPEGKEWRKEVGSGSIELTGSGLAQIKASVHSPCPDRTAYTVEWTEPDFADVQALIDPPGSQRGQGEKGRAGLIFWQDANNYITISTWLDDIYDGTSISSFFYLDGYEELYDAVWTNVGRRVDWGHPYNLRVSFDGLVYAVYVNEEPVLYRSLTDIYPQVSRLAINRVGIVSNWEWGNDTGSAFRHFDAKGKD